MALGPTTLKSLELYQQYKNILHGVRVKTGLLTVLAVNHSIFSRS